MKKIILAVIGLLTLALGQSTWDTGTINFNYGSPFPDQFMEYTGNFLSSDIPNQGVGGFELAMGDTNFLSLVAYDIKVTETDTLADIFALIIQDSVAIEPGFHIVGFNTGTIKLFLWMQDVDPAMVAALIDTSFTLDSLDVFNPYVSLSGQIEITEISPSSISGNFAGTMINTSLDILMISDGTFSIANTLPGLSFNQGSLAVAVDSTSLFIEGDLNPIQNNQGVGAVTTQQGDTLTTTLFAYVPTISGDAISIYGLAFRGLAQDYPEPGALLTFSVGTTPDDVPMALPFFLENASLEELTSLLGGDSLPGLEDYENLYFPAELSSATFGYHADGTAFAMLTDLLMANTSGTSYMLSEDWTLSNSGLTRIDQAQFYPIQRKSLVGHAYPNPFNSSTIIPFELTETLPLEFAMYNILGQQVSLIPIGRYGPGAHQYQLNLGPLDLVSGLYHFRLSSTKGLVGSGSLLYLK